MASTSLSSVVVGLEYSPLPHIVVDERTVVGINQACLKIFGEIIGQPLNEVVIDCPEGQFTDVLVRVKHCTGRVFQMLATSHCVDRSFWVIGLTSPKSSDQDVSLLRHLFAEPITRLTQNQLVRHLSCDFTRRLEKLTFFHRLNGVDEFPVAQESVAITEQIKELISKRTEGDVVLHIAEEIPKIVSNGDAILFIVDELIDNAIVHNPPGCVQVTLDRGLKGEKECVFVTVEDKGRGIPLEAEKSEGVHRSSSGGIGLTVCSALAQRLGGELIINSKSGEGTQVTLILPYAPFQAPVGKIDSPYRKKMRKFSYTALVVDDNEVCGVALLGLLKRRGLQGEWVSSGREAAQRVLEREFQIVFTDIMMPDWDGWQTAKELRAINAKVIVVACTAEEIAKEKLEAAGISFLLSKPITKKKVGSVLSRIACVFLRS